MPVAKANQSDEANARLIAAAPDLLAALKEMRDLNALCFRVIAKLGGAAFFVYECRESGIQNGIGVRAQDAIAKAEGDVTCPS